MRQQADSAPRFRKLPRRVALVLRADFREKRGGDLVQAQRYAEELSRHDVQATIMTPTELGKAGAFDLVHIFNIDLPYEFIEAVRASSGLPIVVSPIHHDARYSKRMMNSETISGIEKLLNSLPGNLREYLAACRRALRGSGTVIEKARRCIHYILRMPNVRRLAGEGLRNADRVLVLSSREEESLQRDFNLGEITMHRLPNGIELVQESQHTKTSARCAVIGRIEPRKRQCEVLEEAETIGLGLTFIGGANENHPEYLRRFKRAISRSKMSVWLGPVPHDQVMNELADAPGLINLSWMEVQSLVELEALASGCWVVAGNSGGNAEYFPDRVFESDPSGTRGALLLAKSLLESGLVGKMSENMEALSNYPTWSEVGSDLLNVYSAILGEA